MRPAVLLPAVFRGSSAERALFSVADGLHPVRGDSERSQELLRRGGPAVTERQVVLRGAAFVAMAFNHDLDLGVGAQERRSGREGVASVGAHIRFVVIEV